MTSFVRPDSPPPRQPSPDILPTPLPPHPRRVPSQPRIRVPLPQGQHRSVHTARSMELASEQGALALENRKSFNGPMSRARQRTISTHAPGSSPRGSPSHSSNRDHCPTSECHKRTLSVAIPSPVPSPTPTVVSLWPPAPSVKPSTHEITCPKPVSLKSIIFDHPSPDLHQTSSRPSLKVPPLEKHRKNMGIACLRFLRIKSQSKQPPTDAVAPSL